MPTTFTEGRHRFVNHNNVELIVTTYINDDEVLAKKHTSRMRYLS